MLAVPLCLSQIAWHIGDAAPSSRRENNLHWAPGAFYGLGSNLVNAESANNA